MFDWIIRNVMDVWWPPVECTCIGPYQYRHGDWPTLLLCIWGSAFYVLAVMSKIITSEIGMESRPWWLRERGRKWIHCKVIVKTSRDLTPMNQENHSQVADSELFISPLLFHTKPLTISNPHHHPESPLAPYYPCLSWPAVSLAIWSLRWSQTLVPDTSPRH